MAALDVDNVKMREEHAVPADAVFDDSSATLETTGWRFGLLQEQDFGREESLQGSTTWMLL